MLHFDFKKPLPHVLSRVLLRTFPGIDKVWVISEKIDNETFILQEANQESDHLQLVDKVQIKRNNFLNTKHFYRWISLDETPLSSDKEARMQYNIFDEYKNRILHLFLPESENGLMLFYIFFNQDQAITGLHTDNRLSTENKQLVSHTIYHLLTYERKCYEHNNYVAGELQATQRRMAGKQPTAHLETFIETFIKDYIAQTAKENQIHATITEEALKYLTTQPFTPKEIEQVIDQALAWLINFSVNDDEKFTIQVSHVIKEDNHTEKQENIENKHQPRYNRTYELLEKLETAGQKVLNSSQKLTGGNVGQAFEPPISAPAITDALRKHAGKIRTLTQLYPNRWQIMRNQFKPLQNVLDSTMNDETAFDSASA